MKATPYLLAALVAAALVPACGSHGFGSGDDGGLGDAPFGGDVAFGDGPNNGSDGSKPNGCDATCVAAGGTCTQRRLHHHRQPGQRPAANADDSSTAAARADPPFAWLYPYDKTVFPRGLLPPTLQFDGGAASDAYVHITFPRLDYKGFFGPSSPPRVALSQPMWNAVIGRRAVGTKTSRSRSRRSRRGRSPARSPRPGPSRRAASAAPSTTRRTTRRSLGGVGSVGIMKIQPGRDQPTIVKSGCGNVCHTASADGSTLVADAALGFSSASYDLKNNAATHLRRRPTSIFTYGGLYPDGSFLMSATNYRTWAQRAPSRALRHEDRRATSPRRAGTASSTTAARRRSRPTARRSPSTTRTRAAGHTLAVMDFDDATKTFSNLVDVATTRAHTSRWPAFTPDAQVGRLPRRVERAVRDRRRRDGRPLHVVDVATQDRAPPRRARRLHRQRHSRTCPANDPTSTSRRRCCPRRSAATSGSCSRATARTATRSPSQGQRRRRTASSGSRRSTSTPRRGQRPEPPGLLPRRPGARRPTTCAASGCSTRASRTATTAPPATSAAAASAARRDGGAARVRPATPRRLLERVREVHDGRRLLRLRATSASTASAPSWSTSGRVRGACGRRRRGATRRRSCARDCGRVSSASWR